MCRRIDRVDAFVWILEYSIAGVIEKVEVVVGAPMKLVRAVGCDERVLAAIAAKDIAGADDLERVVAGAAGEVVVVAGEKKPVAAGATDTVLRLLLDVMTSLPAPPSRMPPLVSPLIRSLPLPPVALSMTVSSAMAMLFNMPLQLVNEPGASLITASWVKPDRSSLLPVPSSQMVITGLVFTMKSK